jgi:hypothetical protein
LQKFPFNIPVNMYIHASLEKALELDEAVWRSPLVGQPAKQLIGDIRGGIEKHGMVSVGDGTSARMYAYEVDGLGNSVWDFDDPNLPSLLSMPLLGYSHYDRDVYQTTRSRLLSKLNPYYFASEEASFAGMGSPHTLPDFVWPLALMVQVGAPAPSAGHGLGRSCCCGRPGYLDAQHAWCRRYNALNCRPHRLQHDRPLCRFALLQALTSSNATEQAQLLRWLGRMQCGNGLMHESVWINDCNTFTRADFGWANAMLVASVEALLGVDCDAEAQALHLQAARAWEAWVANGDNDAAAAAAATAAAATAAAATAAAATAAAAAAAVAAAAAGGAAAAGAGGGNDRPAARDPGFFERLEQTINTISGSDAAQLPPPARTPWGG